MTNDIDGTRLTTNPFVNVSLHNAKEEGRGKHGKADLIK